MRRACFAGLFILLLHNTASAQTIIKLARIAEIPDQFVGGEILRTVYRRLNITVEFVDVPSKRALALSSSGAVDGEVHRIANLARDYPTLIEISPPINYIEPAVFTTSLRFEVRGWGVDQGPQRRHCPRRGIVGGRHWGMARVTAATGLDNLIRMLDAGRLRCWCRICSAAASRSRDWDWKRAFARSPAIERIYIYHYLHQRHRELAAQVAAVIREMDASGELGRLREKLIQQVLGAS